MTNNLKLESCGVELVGLSMVIAARTITRLFDRVLRDYGVRLTQACSLYAITEFRGYNCSYIAKKISMRPDSFDNSLKSMKKYVRFYKDSSDTRMIYPALTEEGSKFIQKIMPKVIEFESCLGELMKGKEGFIEFIHHLNSEAFKLEQRLKKEKSNERKKTSLKKETSTGQKEKGRKRKKA